MDRKLTCVASGDAWASNVELGARFQVAVRDAEFLGSLRYIKSDARPGLRPGVNPELKSAEER